DADRALRVPAEFQLAELHVESVVKHEASDERTAFAEGELQDFGGLDATDDAGQYAKNTTFGATGHHSRRRRFGIETAIARSAEVRRKDAGLAFESENGAVDVRLLQQHAGVVGEVTGREVVRAVDDDVVVFDDVEGVLAADARIVDDDF